MTTEISVNIGSGNGLLPDGTKPLPKPMLTSDSLAPVVFCLPEINFTADAQAILYNSKLSSYCHISKAPMS